MGDSVGFIGPLEHLIGCRYRHKRDGFVGSLMGIGGGYFIDVVYPHFRWHEPVEPNQLDAEWEPVTE